MQGGAVLNPGRGVVDDVTMGKEPTSIRKLRRPAGFTLLEVLIASSILAFTTLALVQAVSAGQSQTLDALRRARGTALAEAMLEEVLSKPYADPQGETTIGPDTGESARADFDNLDDYHGLSEAADAIADADGVVYPQPYQRYTRQVTVESETLDIAALGGARQGMRITVTVAESIDGAQGRTWVVTRFVPEGE